MRILHLGTLYPPTVVGGAERSVELLATQQVRMGHTVAAACLDKQTSGPVERDGVQVYRMQHHNLLWLDEGPQRSSMVNLWHKTAQRWNHGLEREFLAVLDAFRPDVVHTHSLVDISTRVWQAAHERHVPIVHTLRDYDLMCVNSAMFRRGAPCETWHLKCQAVTTPKKRDARLVAGLAGVGTSIIQTHVDAGYFGHLPAAMRRPIWNAAVVEGSNAAQRQQTPRSGPLKLGYLGRICVEKGILTLLEACRLLDAGSYELLVAGTASATLEPFESAAKGLPVRFLGWAAPKDLLEAIDVLVVPSFWAEPLPRTILESYAMGVPVIGARSGGIPELIGADNADWLFEPGEERQLADQIQRVIDLGRSALPKAGDFDHVLSQTGPAVVAQRYIDFYGDVLQRCPKSSLG